MNPSDFKINSNVYIYKKYKINWGSYNHLLAILFLLKQAVYFNISYLHIISGQDIPIKKLDDFECFNNSKKIFMNHLKLSDITNKKIKYRYQYGTRFPNASQKDRKIKAINKIYSLLCPPKSKMGEFEYSQIYKGLVWLSLPTEAAEYVLSYTEKNNFLDSMYHVTIPEEFYFQTILENSKFKNNIAKGNLIYNDWNHKKYGSLPAILDENDYARVVSNDYFFARKIDPKISRKLISRISVEINNF